MSSLRQEARKLQLKTQIADLGHQTRSYNVASVAKRCNEQLKALQEEYKSITGEYVPEWLPLEETAAAMDHAEMSIVDLIKILSDLQAGGKTKVQVKGTLMCQEDGNSIILTTEKQM